MLHAVVVRGIAVAQRSRASAAAVAVRAGQLALQRPQRPQQLHTASALGQSSIPSDGPSLEDFLRAGSEKGRDTKSVRAYPPPPPLSTHPSHTAEQRPEQVFPPQEQQRLDGQRVFIKAYGCQMNVNDSEIAWSILKNSGCVKSETITDADVVLLVTCSIREKAETKIWKKLDELEALKRKRKGHLQVGVLGCMAERLKKTLLEESKVVDLVAGPDAYRDLPAMLQRATDGVAQMNVVLSLDETYADLTPVRHDPSSPSAFVSIQRGCDNMCSYCIVPFTRGRERSRPVESILREVRELRDQGVKEITLLGQNVNSYLDRSETHAALSPVVNSRGFKTIYKTKRDGRTFAHLLERVAAVDPDVRVRFTSPHPKDFPDDVLYAIRDHHNICNQIHMPAQSGSDSVLEQMRRGYTFDSYVELVDRIHSIIPSVTLSSDFIAGYCGETHEDHLATVALMNHVKYDMAYLFAYSLREKTHAHRRHSDDVPEEVKQQRLAELVEIFHRHAKTKNQQREGNLEIVLVESTSKRSADEVMGRTDGNIKAIFPRVFTGAGEQTQTIAERGDYVVVRVTDSTSMSLRAEALMKGSLLACNAFIHELNSSAEDAHPPAAVQAS